MVPRFRCWDGQDMVMRDVEQLRFAHNSNNHAVYITIDGEEWATGPGLILMQSTGLLNCETEDGKNVEGWEGDIADIGWSDQIGEFHSHRIVLKNPFDYSIDEARWLIHAEYIIIRGNIYENPELLEGKHE